MKRIVLVAIMAIASFLLVNGAALAQSAPEFKLGFKALADRIPEIAGIPVEEEHWGANGDSLQLTTTGLMAWRKADNWTAFTNGSRTWINGPSGVAERAVNDRFSWEADTTPAPPPVVPAPVPVSPTAKPLPTTVPSPAPGVASGPVSSDTGYGYFDDKGAWVPFSDGGGDCH